MVLNASIIAFWYKGTSIEILAENHQKWGGILLIRLKILILFS